MFIILIFLSVFAQAAQGFKTVSGHGLSINLNYHEYEILLNTEILFTSKDEYVEKSIEAGQRTIAWLEHINSSLSEEEKWNFYSKEQPKIDVTDPFIEMKHPYRYSLKKIVKRYKEIQKELPPEMASVIFENGNFKDFKDIDKKTFLSFGKRIVSYYKTAVRWKYISPKLGSYARRRENDIRGYYFLSQMKDVKHQLQNWSNLSAEQKKDFSSHLKSICFNTRGVMSICERELKATLALGRGYDFYDKYIHKSKKTYDSFFEFYHKRTDILWTDPYTAFLPLQEIRNERQRHFFVKNVEDEWQWGDWKLKIQFEAEAEASLNFSPSEVARVSRGNRIVMDSNGSLNSWRNKKTIRHELGHVLGFDDCYIEFYEKETGDMVTYSIDLNNIMCDQNTGKISQIHYDKLKEHYFRP